MKDHWGEFFWWSAVSGDRVFFQNLAGRVGAEIDLATIPEMAGAIAENALQEVLEPELRSIAGTERALNALRSHGFPADNRYNLVIRMLAEARRARQEETDEMLSHLHGEMETTAAMAAAALAPYRDNDGRIVIPKGERFDFVELLPAAAVPAHCAAEAAKRAYWARIRAIAEEARESVCRTVRQVIIDVHAGRIPASAALPIGSAVEKGE